MIRWGDVVNQDTVIILCLVLLLRTKYEEVIPFTLKFTRLMKTGFQIIASITTSNEAN